MARYTLPHVAYNMPHRTFDTQHELHIHHATCNPRQGNRPQAQHAAWCFDRLADMVRHASPAAGTAPARKRRRRRPRQPRALRPP